ncbi:MAG TPA: site-2 protease family protein [Anaerolineaceae bacterium]|nr:site-2 protease family protein [Longilinea sp.]HNS36262.1 site-2 protease family protein [Anaerolineaceae bacterium]HQF60968.1 site-2 protease family protein [Anaerolineaceae bacterium]HQH84432.1 site-2 protease family protein [Anaerolineaceae bacterium]
MLNMEPAILITYAITLIISISVHEFAHAWSADRLGDNTPRMYGRVTLNPLAHLDPMGSLMMIFAGFGWGKPVPVNAFALQRRSPAALMLTAIAGPLSNLLLAILAAIPFRLKLVHIAFDTSEAIFPSIDIFLTYFILVNLSLMLFNLIPLSPLDGDKIADYFFPPFMAKALASIRPYAPFVLMGLVFLPRFLGIDILGEIMSPAISNIWMLLMGVY